MEKPNLFNLVIAAGALAALLGMSGRAPAQQAAPKKNPGPAAVTLRNWNYVGNKLITMAEDWPADKYDYRPNNQVRTFAEQLLHAAGSNFYSINLAWGRKEKVDENPSRTVYNTKEKVVAYVKKSVADGAAAIQHDGDAGVIEHLRSWEGDIEHMGEHYGQLVVYYRNNGVVPPASRQH